MGFFTNKDVLNIIGIDYKPKEKSPKHAQYENICQEKVDSQ